VSRKALGTQSASLARLWRDQGKPQQARELLAPVYVPTLWLGCATTVEQMKGNDGLSAAWFVLRITPKKEK
jgi:hypothetical protein